VGIENGSIVTGIAYNQAGGIFVEGHISTRSWPIGSPIMARLVLVIYENRVVKYLHYINLLTELESVVLILNSAFSDYDKKLCSYLPI
jgi:hypothetical protein